MNWLDLFDHNAELDRQLSREYARHTLSQACDDEPEITAPFIDILPDESGKPDGSPLRFLSESSTIDRMINEALVHGMGDV